MLFKQRTGVLHNSFCQSYGLIVLTKGLPEKVMLVERKIPYCLQNLLLKKMSAFLSNKYKYVRANNMEILKSGDTDPDSSTPSYEIGKDWYRFVQLTVAKMLDVCKKETHLYDDADFERYENGLVFEDQFDFPHGQMSAKTKKILRNYIHELYYKSLPPSEDDLTIQNVNTKIMKNEFYFDNCFTNGKLEEAEEDLGGSLSMSPTCKFLKKLAEFLTAFMEFEEETGHTFRFDLKTILKLKTIHIQFIGLDGYEYLQKFFILQVDKINKLFRSHQRYNNYTFNSNIEYALFKSKHTIFNVKKRKQSIFREIDRQTYKARLLNIEQVVKLLWNQQKELGKWDFKHILPKCLTRKNLNNHIPDVKFDSEQPIPEVQLDCELQKKEEEMETLAENMFLDLTKRIDPDIYYRCVRRIKWREK